MARMYPPRLRKMDVKSKLKKLKRREFVYVIEDHTDHHKQSDINLILTQDLEGLGNKGDKISVRPFVARNELLSSGIAVYASPENLEKYAANKDEKNEMPLSLQKTLRQLEHMTLKIPMSNKNPWELNKSHVRIAFRWSAVIVPEDAITMPMEKITEPQDTTIQLTVNGKHKVSINAVVYHCTEDKEFLHSLPPTWKKTKRSLSEIIASLNL